MNKYVARLYNEWKAYGKIIIAVDYDSTIAPWPTIDNQEDIDRVVKLLQIADNTGAYIVINTCSNIDRFEDIQRHCEYLRIPISAINTNPIDLPYGKHGKLYGNIYLDDRAGLKEALDILEEVMYRVRSDNNEEISETWLI